MYTPESQPTPTVVLPTMYDLPSENPEEPGLPDIFHLWQPRLLDDTCRPPNYPPERVFLASDLNIYYDLQHLNWYKRPDWFVVLGVPRFYEQKDLRLSYVIWQEKVSPLVIVELLSEGTEDEDLGETTATVNQPPTKWEVYEQILQVPYYFVFSRYTNKLRFFRLVRNRYSEQMLTEPRVWIPELKLGLGLWVGAYKDCNRPWLRWYDVDGNWVLNLEESQEKERLAKEAALIEKETALIEKERERLEKERERVEKEAALAKAALLAEKLREMGIDPDQFSV